MRPKTTSKRRTGGWLKSSTRTSTPATNRPRTSLRKSRPLTTSSATLNRPARYDRGELDASGAERPQQRYYHDFAEAAGSPYTSNAGFADLEGVEDILSQFFGRQAQGSLRTRGSDVHYGIELDFLEAINGGKRQITLPDGSVLDVNVPPGTSDGQILRLRGKGRPGIGGGPPGDALIEIQVRPHPIFTRRGDNIHVELPILVSVAVLGGKVEVPTPTGSVRMTVPKWSNTGAVLRLKGRGVPRVDGSKGDELVTLKIMLPEKPDPELEKFFSERRAYTARQGMDAST